MFTQNEFAPLVCSHLLRGKGKVTKWDSGGGFFQRHCHEQSDHASLSERNKVYAPLAHRPASEASD